MAKKNAFNFTEERLRNIPLPETGKREYYNDTDQKGLRLAVSGTGVKSFQFQRWSPAKQRPVIVTLGKWPTLPLHSARNMATAMQAVVNKGEDPQLDKKATRDTQTIAEMLDKYLEDYSKPEKRSWQDDEMKIRLYLKPAFGRLLVTELTQSKIITWLNKTKKEFSGATANRRLALLSVAYTKVEKTMNPCKGIKRFKETSCERYLRGDELERLFDALGLLRSEGDIDNVDYVELSLLTGARQANVLSMTWHELDLNMNLWHISGSKSKNGKTLTISLSGDAIAILERRKEIASSVFVFPSYGETGHLQEPYKGWQRILNRAGIEHCRLHDLRHTLASYQAMTGSPESVIGKALGHQDVETTRKYTHLAQKAVLESLEKAVALMKTPIERKVVNISGKE